MLPIVAVLSAVAGVVVVILGGAHIEMLRSLLFWSVTFIGTILSAVKGSAQRRPAPVLLLAGLPAFALSALIVVGVHRSGPIETVRGQVLSVDNIPRKGRPSWWVAVQTPTGLYTLGWGNATPPFRVGQDVDALLQTRIYTDVYTLAQPR